MRAVINYFALLYKIAIADPNGCLYHVVNNALIFVTIVLEDLIIRHGLVPHLPHVVVVNGLEDHFHWYILKDAIAFQ